MPSFTTEQHANGVAKELMEAVQKLSKKARAKRIKKVTKTLAESDNTDRGTTTSEGATQRVDPCPEVTIITGPTRPESLHVMPRTHQRATFSNVPIAASMIERPSKQIRRSPRLNQYVTVKQTPTVVTPTSNRIPIMIPKLVSQEEIHFISRQI